jgi:hypothetical protein
LSSAQRPLDPFGLVAWPKVVVAAREMHRHALGMTGKKVLVLETLSYRLGRRQRLNQHHHHHHQRNH